MFSTVIFDTAVGRVFQYLLQNENDFCFEQADLRVAQPYQVEELLMSVPWEYSHTGSCGETYGGVQVVLVFKETFVEGLNQYLFLPRGCEITSNYAYQEPIREDGATVKEHLLRMERPLSDLEGAFVASSHYSSWTGQQTENDSTVVFHLLNEDTKKAVKQSLLERLDVEYYKKRRELEAI